jgi:hypothetical protein
MLAESKFVGLIVLALLGGVSPASAQAVHEFFGPPVPLVYDAHGARHFDLYGYDGPPDPPMDVQTNVPPASRRTVRARPPR